MDLHMHPTEMHCQVGSLGAGSNVLATSDIARGMLPTNVQPVDACHSGFPMQMPF